MRHPEFIAFIPARGGSKSIPLKNTREIAGKPLLYWTAKAAQDCSMIEEIYISTDMDYIEETALSFNFSKLKVVKRSAESSTDTAPTEMAVFEFVKDYCFKNMILIQATSPLLAVDDLLRGIKRFQDLKCDSLLSLVNQKRFLWEDFSGLAKPLNYNLKQRPMRQKFKGQLVENGAYYIFNREGFLKHKCRLFGKIGWVEMDAGSYFEIDEPDDFIIVEQLLLNRFKRNKVKSKAIKLFIIDVDGTLTDGGMYYSGRGEELKKFNTRDGKGIELLKSHGIKVAFLTSENSDIIQQRASKLKIDFLLQGCQEKLKAVENLVKELSISLSDVAFIGDDVNDTELLNKVGLSATPKNGCKENKKIVDYISPFCGGEGCVRDFTDYIIENMHKKGKV